jgi:putative NIF3 family GTP cyclohydrolase 1 type 2
VRSVAVAAGAGGSVLRGVAADGFITGEMSHHDALAAVAAGTSVVCAGHSNTERGFLRVLKKRLDSALDGDLDVRIARSDHDPFTFA